MNYYQGLKILSGILLASLLVASSKVSAEKIIFIGDSEYFVEQNTLIIDDNHAAGENVKLQFGRELNEFLQWDEANQYFVLSDDLSLSGHELKDFRLENLDGSTAQPVCDAASLGRTYYDTFEAKVLVCSETGASAYGWINMTASTASTSTKVVTVGSGSEYNSIANAASYLNSLTGGIMLLSAENHQVSSSVDLTSITMIGANTGDTQINISGSGRLRVKETQFKSLTINIDSALSASSGLDVIYSPSTTSSVIFEWVDFNIGGSKYLIDSSEATSPIARTRFISSSAIAGNRQIIPSKTVSNLDNNSTHFIESQGGSGSLNFADWNVTISGSGNVVTTGLVETIPGETIFVYPGMNIQAAIDSIPSGGVITLLPGTHEITTTLSVNHDDIEIVGYGDSSVVRAANFTTSTQTTAAIHIGAPDGSLPVNNVTLKDFKLAVDGPNIHGIRAAGGEDIQLYNLTVQKTSGTAGSGSTARIGIQMLDGTSSDLVRPVIKNCRVFGNGTGNYFTDGIHITGGPSYGFAGIWMNGNQIRNALVESNNIDYVRETVAVFIGVSDSSLYNNRFSRMGAGGAASYGIFLGNSQKVNMSSNVISRSLSPGSYGFVIDNISTGNLKEVTNSVISSNTIDGTADGGVGFRYAFLVGSSSSDVNISQNTFMGNTVKGASSGWARSALYFQGNFSNNILANNIITGGVNEWDIGIDLDAPSCQGNLIRGNRFENTTLAIDDNGQDTLLGVGHHRASINPAVTDDQTRGYSVGTIWVNEANDSSFILVDATQNAAIWKSLDGGSNTNQRQVGFDLAGAITSNVTLGTVGGGNSAVLRFGENKTSEARWSFVVPSDWNGSSNLELEIIWSPSDGGSGTLDLGLLFGNFAIGDTVSGAGFTDLLAGVNPTVNAATELGLYSTTATIASAAIAPGELANISLVRNPKTAADTYGGDINIHLIRLNYQGN
jgi:hypothetical protein